MKQQHNRMISIPWESGCENWHNLASMHTFTTQEPKRYLLVLILLTSFDEYIVLYSPSSPYAYVSKLFEE